MKILDLEITQLHGLFDGRIQFDPQVTVLSGINGSFKSTILQLLKQLTFQTHPSQEVEKLVVHYADGIKAYYYAQQKEDEEGKITQQLTRFKGANYLTKEQFAEEVQMSVVTTFDVPLSHEMERMQEVGAQVNASYLDAELSRLARDFKDYCTNIFQHFLNSLPAGAQFSKENVTAFYQEKEDFCRKINAFFVDTHKACDPQQMELVFTHKDGKQLPLTLLSSGEKQLLILLLTVFLQGKKEYVVLMDEPEISLHVRWQYQLLEVLTQLNPNAQFILTTHSPSIVADGWEEKIVYVEDVITRSYERR